MARIRFISTVAILVIRLASVGNAQQVPATDSVADAAREQKAIRSTQKKAAEKKVYTNSDVGESDATAPKTDTQTSPDPSSSEARAEARASSPNPDHLSAVKNEKSLNSGDEPSPVLDRRKQAPDTIVVPVGTKITVDISEENPPRNLPLRIHSAKVVNIVQVGSSVVIPALSKVTIRESVGVMELTDVTIDGVRYELSTDRVARLEGSMSEATFTLTRSFTIKR
jgi:hypothetical protein